MLLFIENRQLRTISSGIGCVCEESVCQAGHKIRKRTVLNRDDLNRQKDKQLPSCAIAMPFCFVPQHTLPLPLPPPIYISPSFVFIEIARAISRKLLIAGGLDIKISLNKGVSGAVLSVIDVDVAVGVFGHVAVRVICVRARSDAVSGGADSQGRLQPRRACRHRRRTRFEKDGCRNDHSQSRGNTFPSLTDC
jgi:hypothetical protein